jgi:hypothetical protein
VDDEVERHGGVQGENQPVGVLWLACLDQTLIKERGKPLAGGVDHLLRLHTQIASGSARIHAVLAVKIADGVVYLGRFRIARGGIIEVNNILHILLLGSVLAD